MPPQSIGPTATVLPSNTASSRVRRLAAKDQVSGRTIRSESTQRAGSPAHGPTPQSHQLNLQSASCPSHPPSFQWPWYHTNRGSPFHQISVKLRATLRANWRPLPPLRHQWLRRKFEPVIREQGSPPCTTQTLPEMLLQALIGQPLLWVLHMGSSGGINYSYQPWRMLRTRSCPLRLSIAEEADGNCVFAAMPWDFAHPHCAFN